MKTGFIGLGAMGASMAKNVASAGYLHRIWNRTRSTAEALSESLGVDVAASPEDLASEVDVILCCVSADQDVLEVMNRIAPVLRAGMAVVDFSTVDSDTAVEASKIVSDRGAEFLDSPVSGGVEGARKGNLALMVGGRAETLQRIRPVLDTMGHRIVHMGPVGSGQGTKAVNQLMAAGINQAVTEALAFAAAQGLDMQRVIEVVSSGAAANWFLQHRGPSMTQHSFAPGFRLHLHHKDLMICQQSARNLGFESRLIDCSLQDYEVLIQQGFGDEDISALYRLKRPQ